MRTMTAADVDFVLAIEQSVQAYPWTRGNFSDALDSGYLCCVDDTSGEISAFAVLMPGVDEAELLNIAVAKSQQRKGLGRAMLSEMLAVAAENDWQRVFLEVRSGNSGAIALYRSAGFAEVGIRRGYYRNAEGSEDAILMVCDLNPDSSLGKTSHSREGGNPDEKNSPAKRVKVMVWPFLETRHNRLSARFVSFAGAFSCWIPAFAGMTKLMDNLG